jgi:replicative DNA helicase
MVSVSGLELQKAKRPWSMNDGDWSLLSAGLQRLAKSPIFVDDTPALTIGAVRSRLMRLAAEIGEEYPEGLGAVVVDYIQLMGVDGAHGDNRNAQIEVISRGLKQAAKELGVPVFALSQLNRNLESRPNKRPVMSDLRDSGSLEQDADVIMFVYRDEVYNRESADKGMAEIIIGKQRNGPTGVVRLAFDGASVRFRNYAGHGYADFGD